MPCHSDRVRKNYDDLCERCLKRPNRNWDSDRGYPYLCEICMWAKYYMYNNILPPYFIHDEVMLEVISK
jgi:hypothetical protein